MRGVHDLRPVRQCAAARRVPRWAPFVSKPVDRSAPLATVWRRAATFSSVCAVTDDDPEPITYSGDFRCVIARDGSAWVGRTYGTYMPEEGAEARSSSLEGLKDGRATWPTWSDSRSPGGPLRSAPLAATTCCSWGHLEQETRCLKQSAVKTTRPGGLGVYLGRLVIRGNRTGVVPSYFIGAGIGN
jgi:hypothetical protein